MTDKSKHAAGAENGSAQSAARPNGEHKQEAAPTEEPIIITDRRGKKSGTTAAGAEAQQTEAADDAPGAAHGGSSPKPSYVVELEAKLADKEARLEATLSQYKDALDEFNRVKARLTRDVQKEIQAGKKSLLVGLLEVVDNLERALDAAKVDPKQAETPLCAGITMVRDQFHAKLSAAGVKKQPALGQPFDPHHFEAISNVPVTDKAQDGRVVGVVRDAYVLGDETLRHGIVAVGKHESAPS